MVNVLDWCRNCNPFDWIFCGLFEWFGSFFTCENRTWFGMNEFTRAPYGGYDWLWSTLYIVAKEYITVIIQLVLFSRIATTPDFLTGSLILFMMLVSFAFPFMSSYLFFVLRLGPFNKNEIVPYPFGLIRNLFQVVLVIIAHAVAAYSAAQFLKGYDSQWQGSGLQMTVGDTASMVSWLFVDKDKDTGSLPMAEEFLNTFIFIIGVLHLMAKHHPSELVLSAYFNVKKKEENSVEAVEPINVAVENTDTIDTVATTSTTKTPPEPKDIALMLESILSKLSELNPNGNKQDSTVQQAPKPPRRLNPMPKRIIHPPGLTADVSPLITTTTSNQRTKKDGTPYNDHIPIPIDFILHVCILLAATTRAFPTAHGTPAISLFMGYMGYSNKDAIQYRIGGGILGSLASLLYYYIWYVWPRHPQVGPAEEFVKRIIIAPPAFLYSELQLPNNMTGHYKNKV